MTTLKSFAQQWESYRTTVVLPESPPLDVAQQRLAFYAGIEVMLTYTLILGTLDEWSQALLMMILQKEVEGFHASLRNGHDREHDDA